MSSVQSAPLAVELRASRRRTFAGAVSIAVHSALLAVVALVGVHAVREAPSIALTPIQVVEPPPPPPPAPPPPQLQPAIAPAPGTLGRRGREPPRSVTRAPADPFADLVVHTEAPPATDPGNRDGDTGPGLGSGLLGEGVGGSDFGVGTVPPAPSRARPPRAREDYSKWDFHAARMFRGAIVRLELTIDPAGNVRDIHIVKGVDDQIDLRAAELARRFAFFPALDDDGKPTWGRHGWEFVIR
jgi:periplasmic protein TonB